MANTSGQFYAEQTLTLQGNQASANARARLVSLDNLRSDVHLPQMSTLVFNGTDLQSETKMAATTSSLDSSYSRTTINENNSLASSKFILSRSNEITNVSGSKSVEYKLNFRKNATQMHALSPVVDLSRTSLTSVKNLVNNVETNEAAASGGDALSKYISRTVTLAEGQDAEEEIRKLTDQIYAKWKQRVRCKNLS